MPTYHLFGGMIYYASGGWKDWLGAFATVEAATAAVEDLVTWQRLDFQDGFDDGCMWWHVVDLTEGQIVARSAKEPY